MPRPIGIDGARFHQMSDASVGLVSGLLLGPMKRLSWVVLLVPDEAHIRHFEQGVGEVLEHSREDRPLFTFLCGQSYTATMLELS